LRFLPNVPNPFNPATILQLDVPAAAGVVVEIYDARGRRVRRLHAGVLAAQRHAFVWDGCDDQGRGLPAGVYWSRAATADLVTSRKLTLVK
jgi:flagellar hook assembly protein FlgD